MSQIRQFGRRRKHFLFTRERAPAPTREGGNLFVCCDCICAQLNLRQNKYMCHNVSKGRGRQSWIEDKKKRIRSVTSCANPGFSRLKLCCTALECRGAFMSIYLPKSTQMSSFSSDSEQRFFFFWHFSILNLHFTSFQPPIKFFSVQNVFTFSTHPSCIGINAERLPQGYFGYISRIAVIQLLIQSTSLQLVLSK